MTTGSNADNAIEKLITPDELAKMLAVSKTTIYRIIERRKMPFCKISGSIRFTREDVSLFIAENRVEPIKLLYERKET